MITTFLFDLGNVLLFFDHKIFLRRMSKYSALSIEQMAADKNLRSIVLDYELGKFSSMEFFNRLSETAQIKATDLTYEEFVPLWSDIFWKNDELISLLPKLKKRYKLGMISNTNDLHINYVQERFPEVFAPFDSFTFSHEIGVMKPTNEIYQFAMKKMDLHPQECIYIDDMDENVVAAKNIGMESIHFITMQGLQDILVHKNLIEV